MANTQILQAVIAYKVRKTDGAPLDINGKPTSETGLRQAIALLVGTPNPNPALFQVELYYSAGAVVYGEPTVKYDPQKCPAGFIRISPNRVILHPTNVSASFTLTSPNAWVVDNPVQDFAEINITAGGAGVFNLTVTRKATEGQGAFIFRNTVSNTTAELYVINVEDLSVWVLDTGNWNTLGFWFDGETWNY